MKRIFYYSGYRLTVFHWLNAELIDSYAFNPAEDGIEKFKCYLLANDNTPVRLLVDLIEEDFNKESIPHVGATDRKSIVSRIVERQYRKSKDYFCSSVLGREKHGRRDDILLYSVLSNPAILEPWLKIIRDTSTNVSGIWSLPLLAHRLFHKFDIQSTNVILVSQQVPSNLRQSFFKNGRFETSRSAVVNLEEAGIGEYISTEVEQTIRFLTNQRQIGFDEKVDVHIICRETDLDEIKSHCSTTNILHFNFHNISLTHKLFNIKSSQQDYCSGLFSFICADINNPLGHYGNVNLFLVFYQFIASRTLYMLSTMMIIFSVVFSISNISESTILDTETTSLQTRTNIVDREYNKNLAQLEEKLMQSKFMQSSVLFVDKVKSSRTISPQNFLVDISHLLNNEKFNATNITNIHWQKNQGENLPVNQTNINSQLIDYGDPSEINQLANIIGFIRVSQSSLKQSVDTTNALAKVFREDKKTLDILIKKIPIDVRPESSIENESSINRNNDYASDQLKGRFELKVLMKGRKSS